MPFERRRRNGFFNCTFTFTRGGAERDGRRDFQKVLHFLLGLIGGGVFINGTPPLFFELSVDVVFPIAEGLTTTLLTLLNNIAGLIFLLLPSIGIEIEPTWIVLATTGSCFIAFVSLTFGSNNYLLKRSMVDDKEDDDEEKPIG